MLTCRECFIFLQINNTLVLGNLTKSLVDAVNDFCTKINYNVYQCCGINPTSTYVNNLAVSWCFPHLFVCKQSSSVCHSYNIL